MDCLNLIITRRGSCKLDEILIKFLPTATSLFRVGLTLSVKGRVRKVEKIGPDLIVGHFSQEASTRIVS